MRRLTGRGKLAKEDVISLSGSWGKLVGLANIDHFASINPINELINFPKKPLTLSLSFSLAKRDTYGHHMLASLSVGLRQASEQSLMTTVISYQWNFEFFFFFFLDSKPAGQWGVLENLQAYQKLNKSTSDWYWKKLISQLRLNKIASGNDKASYSVSIQMWLLLSRNKHINYSLTTASAKTSFVIAQEY